MKDVMYIKWRQHYESLPYLDKLILRKAIKEKCLIPDYTVTRFVSGQFKIPALYQKVISEIVGEDMFNDKESANG